MERTQDAIFGSTLRRLRRDAGLTQEELAERAGLSPRGIGAIERGIIRAPHQSTVLQLADALGLAPEERTVLLRSAHRRLASVEKDSVRALLAIPIPPTPIVGREREIAEVSDLLARHDVRLVTLTGPGGVGKTRLALELAAGFRNRTSCGVTFISLASIRDPVLVASTIANGLGVRESPVEPVAERLLAYLAERNLLLVLDTFEHLLPASGLAARLLSTCTQLQMLVTSREPLHIRGEHEYPVRPLQVPRKRYLPPPVALPRYPAIELFAQRARAVRPDFAISAANSASVTGICAQLDGLPLAIELAAARMKLLSAAELLAQLEGEHSLRVLSGGASDLPARLQTMRSTIAWSHDLLDPTEQTMFRRLSVFSGGCTLEAAQAVCEAVGALDLDTLDGLASLVDKSLVTVHRSDREDDTSRFDMLETVREFAHEQLVASAEAAAAHREHARYFLTLAEQSDQVRAGVNHSGWPQRLEQEHENLRAALQTARQLDDTELGLRLAAALVPLWLSHNHFQEARGWLEVVLPWCGAPSISPATRARVLHAAGRLTLAQGGLERAALLLGQALALARQAGDDRCTAATLHMLGATEHSRGNYEPAEELYEESLSGYRRLNDPSGVGGVLTALATMARHQGDFWRATQLYEEALSCARAVGDLRLVADVLARLGNMATEQGYPLRSLSLYEEAREFRRQIGDTLGIADILLRSGETATVMGDHASALRFLDESLELYRSLGLRYGVAYVLLNQGLATLGMSDLKAAWRLTEQSLELFREIGDHRCCAVALAQLADIARRAGDSQRALLGYRESLRLHRETNTRPEIARCLERIACLASSQDLPQRAARLHGAATAIRRATDSAIAPVERADYERDIGIVRARLGEPEFRALESQGMSMSLEDAVEYALSDVPNGVRAR